VARRIDLQQLGRGRIRHPHEPRRAGNAARIAAGGNRADDRRAAEGEHRAGEGEDTHDRSR
jgi:hypothetical protein